MPWKGPKSETKAEDKKISKDTTQFDTQFGSLVVKCWCCWSLKYMRVTINRHSHLGCYPSFLFHFPFLHSSKSASIEGGQTDQHLSFAPVHTKRKPSSLLMDPCAKVSALPHPSHPLLPFYLSPPLPLTRIHRLMFSYRVLRVSSSLVNHVSTRQAKRQRLLLQVPR